MIHNINPPQLGVQIEMEDDEDSNLTLRGGGAGNCSRCDSSSRCGACGKCSSSVKV